MKVSINIDCDNAAFENPNREIARILGRLSDSFESDIITGMVLHDSNGNRVGTVRVILTETQE